MHACCPTVTGKGNTNDYCYPTMHKMEMHIKSLHCIYLLAMLHRNACEISKLSDKHLSVTQASTKQGCVYRSNISTAAQLHTCRCSIQKSPFMSFRCHSSVKQNNPNTVRHEADQCGPCL